MTDLDQIIEDFEEPIALVDDRARILWGNRAFRDWCRGPIGGLPLGEVLSCGDRVAPDSEVFATARAGQLGSGRFSCDGDRWIDVRASAVRKKGGPPRFVIHLRDVTHEERRRQKLAALHHAGRALNNLDSQQLDEMSAEERTAILKHNIRQIIHELLQYDVIDIRLLDRRTGKLVPLIQEGLSPAALAMELYSQESGQGVTGYVAATGKAYLCHDTATDPKFIEGSPGAKSSLTVPLLFCDEVIGTFNVESPKPDAFSETDVYFTEAFCREIAQALHTLELLSAEKCSAAFASVEAVSGEVALPADEILSTATRLLNRTSPGETETIANLQRIIGSVRSIKKSIQAVGENMARGRAVTPREAALAEKLRGMRVLVVDGNERVRRAAHALMGRYGCLVETAQSDQEAIDLARNGRYDAFFINIRLSDGSAYETYRRIREHQPKARPVMMTGFGYDSSHTIVKARQDGLWALLFLPFRTDQVLEALAGDQSPFQPATVGS